VTEKHEKTSTSTFTIDGPVELESGAILSSLEIAYTAVGNLSPARDNVVWICHPLTGNADPSEWWPGLVGRGKLFDPVKHYIVCANMLGSCYGSSGPASINPETDRRFGLSFPLVTVRDTAQAFAALRRHLKLPSIAVCIGGSMGGQLALEWSIMEPDVIRQSIILAANATFSPWGKAYNAAQRMAIEADLGWCDSEARSGWVGLSAARAIAMISYRSYAAFESGQADPARLGCEPRSSTYLKHQGHKLAERFDVCSYWLLTKVMDNHDVGRQRGGISKVLASITARTLVMGITSDTLFPVAEQRYLADHIPGARFQTIESPYGHDGFLVEYEQLSKAIGEFIDKHGLHEPRTTL
jgi:homoserine O-acetyltransferase